MGQEVGSRFGEWSAEEKESLKNRIKDWAAAHGELTNFEAGNFEFLFKRRQKQGGRGAKLADSERKAFLEIAHEFATRNPKQIYGFISRHYDSTNYKGKWTEEEKEMLQRLTAEHGDKWEGHRRGNGTCWVRMQRQVADDEKQSERGDWTSEEIAKLRELVDEYFSRIPLRRDGVRVKNEAPPGAGQHQLEDDRDEVGDPKREQLYAKVVPHLSRRNRIWSMGRGARQDTH